MSASPTEEPRYYSRPLTREELYDAGFRFADPAWEIAWHLRECVAEMESLKWRVQDSRDELRSLKKELAEALRILGQTIERSTAPWYVRIFWKWRQHKQERQMAEWKAELEKREHATREKQMEIAKIGSRVQQSRFRGRYS